MLFYNSCVIGSSAPVLFTSLTPSIIYSNCFNVTDAKLGKMHTDDDMFANQFGDQVAFPQLYYYFDAYYGNNGTYYVSSDGLYILYWESYYWLGVNIPDNNCSVFQIPGRWYVASPCNVVEYFLCEIQLI